jgi:hypothetical protein
MATKTKSELQIIKKKAIEVINNRMNNQNWINTHYDTKRKKSIKFKKMRQNIKFIRNSDDVQTIVRLTAKSTDWIQSYIRELIL